MFQDGRCNTSPTSPYYNVTIDSFRRIHSLRATSGHHYLVSGTFHPPIGVLFSFPSRYFYSIGLETYLELGVDASHIHAQYPMDTTQEKIIHKTSKKHIYGTITLYGSKIPNKNSIYSKKSKSMSIHHISHNSQSGIQFVLYRFRSPLLTISHIAFFSSTY